MRILKSIVLLLAVIVCAAMESHGYGELLDKLCEIWKS